MTLGGSARGTGIRSANAFPCQQNPLKRGDFGKVTVEDEPRPAALHEAQSELNSQPRSENSVGLIGRSRSHLTFPANPFRESG